MAVDDGSASFAVFSDAKDACHDRLVGDAIL